MTRWKWTVVAETVVIVALLVGIRVSVHHTAFNPLTYPVERTTAASYRLGDPVTAVGTKCSSSTQPLFVSGTVTWVSVNPSGIIVPVSRGTGLTNPGCVSVAFTEAMPTAVISATATLFDRGVEPVTWRITGAVTPLGHRGAVTVGWGTNNFTVTP